MAKKVRAQVLGGTEKEISANASTVNDVKNELGLSGDYTAQINGEDAEMSDSISDFQFITFAKAVKGGR